MIKISQFITLINFRFAIRFTANEKQRFLVHLLQMKPSYLTVQDLTVDKRLATRHIISQYDYVGPFCQFANIAHFIDATVCIVQRVRLLVVLHVVALVEHVVKPKL